MAPEIAAGGIRSS